jgi:pimeloyl-ACP methyl ester carboxylesterase
MTRVVIRRTGDSRADASLYPPITGTPHGVRSYDGTELAVLVAGDGPPLVLAHGSLVSSSSWALMWRPLVDAGYRLIAYDLRGHGLSTLGGDGFGTGPYGRDLAAVLGHFEVRDGVVVGHSAGAIGTLALAAQAPDVLAAHVRGLVLASASPRGIGDSVQKRLLAPVIFSGLIVRVLRRPRSVRAFARTPFGDQPDADHNPDRRRATPRKVVRPNDSLKESQLAAGRGAFTLRRTSPTTQIETASVEAAVLRQSELVAPGARSGNLMRTRWLANAEADHGGHDTAAEGGAREPGAGAAAAKPVTLADRDVDERARSGEDGVRAGGAGHAPQTELAESEAVSGDRTRPPPPHSPPPLSVALLRR